jgi:heat shock protein HtpX
MAARRTSDWARDRGLEARMASTLFLLGLAYSALIAAVVLAGVSAIVVFSIAAVLAVVQLATSDRLALRAVGAREVTPAQAPKLHAALDRACIQMDMPKPRLMVSELEVANALAVGRTRERATVCVMGRAIRLLDPPELEAVLAHELAYIQNRDALVMTVASFFSLVSALVLRIGFQVGHVAARLLALAIALATYVVSFVLLRALSRYRELSADRVAALATGRPSALASALIKLDDAAARTPREDMRKAAPVSALCINAAPGRSWLPAALSTHPRTDRRVAALERLERRLQGTA